MLCSANENLHFHWLSYVRCVFLADYNFTWCLSELQYVFIQQFNNSEGRKNVQQT